MPNKELTIEACRQLIRKYKKARWIGKLDLGTQGCPLCKIHFQNECLGCPNLTSLKDHTDTCGDQFTYSNVRDSYRKYSAERNIFRKIRGYLHVLRALNERIEFWKRVIPRLEELSEERFTREGFKPIPIVKIIDEMVYSED